MSGPPGDRRAFVHYNDLIRDWRAAMALVADGLGLSYDTDLSDRAHHEVDDFIDVSLRRVQVTLDDLDVPANLRQIAEQVWNGLDALSRDPDDADAMGALDRVRDEYDQLFVHSAALVQDETDFALLETRRRVRRQVTRRLAREAAADPAPPDRSTLRRAAGKVRRVLSERHG